jgi:hypothetical protein
VYEHEGVEDASRVDEDEDRHEDIQMSERSFGSRW